MTEEPDPFWDKWLELSDQVDDGCFTELDLKEQYFYALNHLRGSNRNGGLHLYFSNASAIEIETVEKALQENGGQEFLDLLRRAKAIAFPHGVPADESEYHNALVDWTDEDIEQEIEPQWSIDLEPIHQEAFSQRQMQQLEGLVSDYFDAHFPK